MRHKLKSAWQLLRVALLFGVLAFTLGRFTYTANAVNDYCVAGDFQTEAGHGSDWDAGVFELTDPDLDGIYTFSTTISGTASHEFKIVQGCAWGGAEYPGPRNSWFNANDGATHTFSIDTNTYTDGFTPAQNIVNVTGDTEASITAVGSWQGWSNPNAGTLMTDPDLDGIYTLEYTVANVGNYEAKLVETGNWGRQITSIGYERDYGSGTAASVFFDTTGKDETVLVTLNTNTGRFAYQPQGDGITEAAQDNNIFWASLGHDSRSTVFRYPGGPVGYGTMVALRLRAAKNDLTAAYARLWNDRADVQSIVPMTRVAADDTYEYWEYILNTGDKANVFYYRFIAVDGTATAYYEDPDAFGGWGETIGESQDKSWQLTVYDPAFQTPDWVKEAVVYQIFVDRFRDGNPANNLPNRTFFYGEAGGTINRSLTANWNTPVCDPREDSNNRCEGSYSRNFYGGDLKGIINQLDYIQDLGVTALYLNPIFESPSNHKYDTRDFSQIDDNFGTLKNFKTLMTAAETRGIKVILDGVFNHTSSDSYYFDRYNRYSNAVYGLGACESVNSPRANWYTFFNYTGGGASPCSDNRDYPKWFGIFDSLPVLRTQEKPAQNLIFGNGFNHTWSGVSDPIAKYWIELGADGWRLDVAPEVDHGVQSELTDGRQTNNPYWEKFRRAVHEANPDAYIVGEEWGLATSWTSGGVSGGVTFPNGNPGEWDATMNYQFGSAIMSYWRDTSFTDNDHNSGSSAGELNPINSTTLNNRLLNLQERYSPEAFAAMMNLLGSHDTSRAMFMVDPNLPSNPTEGTVYPVANDVNYDAAAAIERLKGVALLQFTLPGAPTVYYGDEVGLVGPQRYSGGKWEDDPYNRQPYPWLDETGTPFFEHLQAGGERDTLQAYYTLLATTRNNNQALSTGDFKPLLMQDFPDDPIYAYGRKMGDLSSAAVVIVNRSSTTQDVTVNVAGYLPIGATFEDALTAADENYAVESNGDLTALSVPAMSGVILTMDSGVFVQPSVVTDLAADGGVSEVNLAWSGTTGVVYDIYRGIVSGGYELIASDVDASVYTDNDVVNGRYYYYALVAKDALTGLASGFSNQAIAYPELDLTSSWRAVVSDDPITHEISTVTSVNVYAQIYVAGATDVISGQVPGITAEFGYGLVADINDAGWAWIPMTFNTEVGNNDEYMISFFPDEIGTFRYAVRFSPDEGDTWVYGGIDGPHPTADLGTLNVNPSGDITSPTGPTNLTLLNATASSISFSWDASNDTRFIRALDGYRIYRRALPDEVDFTMIGSTVDTTYEDMSVVTGTTYEYYVTALDDSFNESDASETLTASAINDMIEVTFITTVPSWTPNEVIYIVGNQPVWGPWTPNLNPMTKTGVDTWEWTGLFVEGTNGAYKHNRAGSWDKVEKGADGNAETEKAFTVVDQGDGKMTIEHTVLNWRDILVTATNPSADATDVDTATTISVTFNKSVETDTTFSVKDYTGIDVAGVFAYDDGTKTVTFTPDLPLASGRYGVAVTSVSAGDGGFFFPARFNFYVGVAQLIANGSFETVHPTLTNQPDVWNTAKAKGVRRCSFGADCYYLMRAVTAGTSSKLIQSVTDLDLDSSAPLEVGVRVRTSSIPKVVIQIHAFDAGGNVVGSTIITLEKRIKNFKQFNRTITLSANATTIRVRVINRTTVGQVHIDDVVVAGKNLTTRSVDLEGENNWMELPVDEAPSN